ncbi:hypothetical protein BXQ17_07905 [Polaribacter sp. BM10]|uniref:hypothetical protein n=1 Tax=Polaribacter sp. BM10 TaxID=1529069 RepID=UPI00098B44AD|nr:hypothetical protein [Polaribacter sp. BM10]AQS93989.1 hypothetical protein BXQ17_07905 [Polaribacter sp. BM10]
MSKNSTIFIAEQLIQQIDEESTQCSMWLISSINRFLKQNPNMSLLEFKRIISDLIPDTNNSFNEIMETKGLKTIN